MDVPKATKEVAEILASLPDLLTKQAQPMLLDCDCGGLEEVTKQTFMSLSTANCHHHSGTVRLAPARQVGTSAVPRVDSAPMYAPPVAATGRAWAVVFLTHYAGLSLKPFLISETDLLTKSITRIAREALGDFLKPTDGIAYHHVRILENGRFLRRVEPSGSAGPTGGGHLHIKILANASGTADSDTFSDISSIEPNSGSSQSDMSDTASSGHISSDGESDYDDSPIQSTGCPNIFSGDPLVTTTCDELGPKTAHTIEAAVNSDGGNDGDDSSSQTTGCPDVFISNPKANTTCDKLGPETTHTIEASPVISDSLENGFVLALA